MAQEWLDKQLERNKELYTEKHLLKTAITTWNVRGAAPEKGSLPATSLHNVDMAVLCFQEAAFAAAWSKPEKQRFLDTLEEECLGGSGHVLVADCLSSGLLTLVYLAPKHTQHVGEVFIGANKPAIFKTEEALAVALRIHNSVFCVVNTRFHHSSDSPEKRNAFHRNILETTALHCEATGTSITLRDCAVLFWCGDLNYKTAAPRKEASSLLEKKQFDLLARYDHLGMQQKNKNAFEDFAESRIEFPPTYRIVPTQSEYALSAVPCYPDRILWRKYDGVFCLSYASGERSFHSDHLPVVGEYAFFIHASCEDKKNGLVQTMLRHIDLYENSLIPRAELFPVFIDIGTVYFLARKFTSFSVVNTGNTILRYAIETEKPCRWVSFGTSSGVLYPGQKEKIPVSVCVKKSDATKMNTEVLLPEIVVRVKIKGNGEKLVHLHGVFAKTLLCTSLEEHVRRKTTTKPDGTKVGVMVCPWHLWRLLDLLQKKITTPDLFLDLGHKKLVFAVLRALDTKTPLTDEMSSPGGVRAAAHALLILLRCLSVPVIPPLYRPDFFEADTPSKARKATAHIPPVHKTTFLHLLSFLTLLVTKNHTAGKARIATAFVKPLFGNTLSEKETKKAEAVLLLLLAGTND
ncbi:MAG: inositol polyphosphate 5-phosphatase [Amphiamblys sp. WSBS2006]|nr:MAG: inositol polyphosphate 5-phosphatase [Amphiamblys sp. WSBS2006]